MSQRESIQPKISHCAQKFPFAFTTMLLTFITVVFIQNFYSLTFQQNIFYNYYQKSVLQYQVYRVFFSFLRERSLIVAVIVWWHIYTFLPKFEVKNGSVIVFFQFFVTNFLIQFLVLLVQALLFYVQEARHIANSYIWIYFGNGIAGIFINVYYKYTFFNLQRRNRYYVAFLAIMFCVISMDLRLDVVFGFLLTLIECHCFKGGIMFFSSDSYSEKDAWIYRLKCNKILRNWIKLNPQSIKVNDLCVVEARQFYMNVNQNSSYIQAGQKMKEVESEIEVEGYQLQPRVNKNQKTQKWEQCEIIQSED